MYLKKIELFGFKSFANKTTISFEPGLTCVVGPNGCGKSNISDSIRWVLGERSAKILRGSKMEDVIFNGTEMRKPVNFAEVSLTIDNVDHKLPIPYEEAVITRRLYRTGESEYLINKTPCRRKDIMDLILDTGIGSNSYSMIEQGRIDYILNAEAEERRYLIEEAAGISKYKVKKEEALRKLERTEQNLLRLNDIVSEVERNIRYAERQAKRAEKFKQQLDQLKNVEIRRAFFDLNTIDQSLKAVNEEKRSHEVQLEHDQQESEKHEQTLRRYDAELQRLEQSFFQEEQTRSEAKQELISFEHHEVFGREKIESLKLACEKALGEIESLENAIARLEAEINERESKSSEFQKTISSLREQDQAIQSQVENQNKESLAHSTNGQAEPISLMEAARKLAEAKNGLNHVQVEIATSEHTVATVNERLQQLHLSKQTFLERRQLLEKEKNTHRTNDESSDEKLNSVISDRNRLALELEDAENKIKQIEERKTNLENQTSILEELSLAEEADPKQIMKQFKSNHGTSQVMKALMDLIHIESGYEVAVEAVLASSLKAVVAEDMNSAVHLLEHITKNGSKQTTIMIRDRAILNGALTKDPRVVSHPAVRQSLWDVVRVEDGYEGILGNLLGNTYLIDELTSNNASQLSELSHKNKFVTRAGAILGPEFQITLRHHRFTPEQSFIARTEKLSALKKELKTLTEELELSTQQRSTIERALDQVIFHESQLQEEIRQIAISTERIDGTLSELEKHLLHMEEELEVLEREKTQSAQERLHFGTEEQKALHLIHELEAEQSRAQESFQAFKQVQEYEQRRRSEIDVKIEIAEAKRNDCIQTLTLLKEQLEAAVQRKEVLEGERAQAGAQITQLTAEIEALAEKKTQAQDLLLSRSVAVEQQRQKRNEILQIRNEEAARSQQILKTLETEKQASNDLRFQEMELNHKKNSIAKELCDRYKIQLSQLNSDDFAMTAEERESIESQIEELRTKMDAAGPVNLLAIDEYDELKKRFDFLDAQKRDLNQAKESLLEAIREINRTTKKLFEETLAKVKEAFSEYFRILFSGGHADLILLDEVHPLDSGLDIVARPPGKKMQFINLLSGGEKALTAIALLLALFSVRPSPFCILDEVDAPLDEANNERFLKMLKPFLDHTQFIIITHSRKTISTANALYGITMHERGVSSVVSVRLSESNGSIEHSDEKVKRDLNHILN
ncbi:MAG: chromosome segregation protein SMC [Omnitrophica bacterium RIFCSPHIGHO2_02_FULL_49_9]|nr:MAG: chromosome segregation protein SMC [Omnitrophica bacterium RIFCSPHIGHO2_02_FULL_49_9]